MLLGVGIVFAMSAAFPAWAGQPETKGFGTVIGFVTEAGEPSQDTHAGVMGFRVRAQTNRSGWFRLERVPVGVHIIGLWHADSDLERRTVSVRAEQSETLYVSLTRHHGCQGVDPAHLHAGCACFRMGPHQQPGLGVACQVHRNTLLEPDIVKVVGGFPVARPGFDPFLRDSFPNARKVFDAGCVIRGFGEFTGVAYCRDCRLALERWHERRRQGH